jgi:TrkA domain protein
MNVDETNLPGLGRRKDFMTASGRRIGVVERREGQTELIVSTWDDPDTCQASIPLTSDEAATLGNLLGGTEEHKDVPGIVTRQFSIAADSPFQNQPMGKACIRTRCGVSIVAIMREGEVLPSPGPDVVLHPGDLLVAVGTQEGLDSAADILRHG